MRSVPFPHLPSSTSLASPSTVFPGATGSGVTEPVLYFGTGTLGYAIFTGLEKNEYLNEIYDALLHNDFLRLFCINDTAPKAVSTEDALRFADLLSKSVNTEQSERHRSLAQEIITLLDMLNPNDEEIQYVMGSVLSSTSNYLGLQHSVPDFQENNVFDRLSDEVNRDYLKGNCRQSRRASAAARLQDYHLGRSYDPSGEERAQICFCYDS